MATYAAYRHVELDNVGYGKKRVLKPPGGGSSDIFGGSETTDGPRRVKQNNQQQSQLGSGFFTGEPQKKLHQQTPLSNGSSTSSIITTPDSPRSKPDGNPVTGTGYENATGPQNGNISGSASSAGSEKSSTDSSPSAASSSSSGVLRMKNRVPPGGFSSGLW